MNQLNDLELHPRQVFLLAMLLSNTKDEFLLSDLADFVRMRYPDVSDKTIARDAGGLVERKLLGVKLDFSDLRKKRFVLIYTQ